MQPILNLDYRREFGDCFYLEIPLNRSMEEIKKTISHATSIEKSVKNMLDGTTNLEDLIEEVEPIILDLDIKIDDYLEVVEENMEYTLFSQLLL